METPNAPKLIRVFRPWDTETQRAVIAELDAKGWCMTACQDRYGERVYTFREKAK